MTDHSIPVTEDELHAYVDNELPAERSAAVEAWLVSHPADADRVRSWRAMTDALHAKYDHVADEAVPPHLNINLLSRPPRRWAYALMAATLAAFIVGGGAGYELRGRSAQLSTFTSLTRDALEAHTLYVVEVRHPVEVAGSDRSHLQQWLSKRCGYEVRAPELDATGLKLVGGRLLPGPAGPASFLMYETASGERFTIYASKASTEIAQMRYTSDNGTGALFWADRGVGYVVSGAGDRQRLEQVARLVYDQNEKAKL